MTGQGKARHNIFYITGLSCTGKTTLLDSLKNSLNIDAYSFVNFSRLLKQEFDEPPADWADLPNEYYEAGVINAVRLIMDAEPAIVSGHVFAERHGRRAVISAAWEAILPCMGVGFLSVRPEVVAQRLNDQRQARELQERAILPALQCEAGQDHAQERFASHVMAYGHSCA